MSYKAKDLGGMKFGDAIVIGDTGKRTRDGQQIVLLRDSKDNLHETSSVNLSRKIYTGYKGSKRNSLIGKRLSNYLTQEDRINNGKKAVKALQSKYFKDGTSSILWNQKTPKNSKTGIKGVNFDKSRNEYRATLFFKGKRVLNKRVKTIEEAKALREEAEQKYFKETN